ncbi:MAG: phosphoenolpyruvate carboxylase [Chloroflexi bacterium]|nr:phosphoenolpyruvate carboxylase [Chloroflexota bacterium]
MELSKTIRLLGNLLGQVICEQESPAIYDIEERIRAASKARRAGDVGAAEMLAHEVGNLSAEQARAVAAAFALYFDLVNLAEENHRVSTLRDRVRDRHPEAIPESIDAAIKHLKDSGTTLGEMDQLLNDLHIELVLTAHPTQAKRRTLLSKVFRIAKQLERLTHHNLLPAETEEIKTQLYAEVTTFWLTNRARTSNPEVTDEVRTGLYFIDETFWNVLPRMYSELQNALDRYYPGLTISKNWLMLASWMGGDRDGNPNVTHKVTAETLRLHRGLAVEKHRAAFRKLSRLMSFDDKQLPPPQELNHWFEEKRPLPPHLAFLNERYSHEPYRLALALLAKELEYASREDMTQHLVSDEPHSAYIQVNALTHPLGIIARAVPEQIKEHELSPLMHQLNIFGLHAARLDIREESSRINSVVGEILRGLKVTQDFESCDAEHQLEILSGLLEQPAPKLARYAGITEETAETWSVFKLLARVKNIYGTDLIGPFIVSMTESAADVLAVLLLAGWAGCTDGLQIAPLFETVKDLEDSHAVLETLFMHNAYARLLRDCANEQMVMIGYSDSNKDGGYLTANWELYQAQENIAAMCKKHAITLTLFHGRGGTVARGGGPANRAILAQPPDTINGCFRVTEQGEVISSRYANPSLAHRHLEQIVSAVLVASSPQRKNKEIPRAWRSTMDSMASAARKTFRSLVYETPDFLQFWQEVTPLIEITRMRIGSRPSARRSGQQKVTKIRAIPWVFSWMQSRFNLPSWYGLGSGLAAAGDQDTLKEMYAEWPFFRALLDNTEMSLRKADMGIAELYVSLASDTVFAQQTFATIKAEYNQTLEMLLTITGYESLMQNEPRIQRSIDLRNPYIDPLNYIQVEILRRLRQLPDESEDAQVLRETMILTVNGIAAGLKNTG